MNESGFADLLNSNVIASGQLIVDTLILPNLDANSIPFIDADKTVSDIVLNNGEIIVGKTGNAPIKNTLTGTTDQVNITNGPGTITLSLSQSITTTSSPSFNNLTVHTINGKIGNDLVTGPASAVTDRLASYNGITGKVIKDSLLNTLIYFYELVQLQQLVISI